jgi:predicted ATPase/DNA-binding CsgD family transcriptional regulator/uncharacterized protein HemY
MTKGIPAPNTATTPEVDSLASVESASARSRRSTESVLPVLDPVVADSLLGRAQELAGVAGALATSPLVTLTGAPGIGKTRLALASARAQGERVAVVELAPVDDPALLPAALASAVSLQEVPGLSLIETVVSALRRRRLLLVLDSCEHLLPSCARTVETLLAECAQVRVLATSREPLGLKGERVWQVPPLPVPERVDGIDAEELTAYPAVALFVARALEVQVKFTLSAFVAADVAEICRRLDGIPLAIELAAARVETLTPSEIVGRLQDRLGLLSTGGSGPLPRHRTLEAALDWSHALLSASERVLLRRLSVFAGRFGREAAEAVCTGVEVDPPGVSPLLTHLVSKSLLVAEDGSDGQARYRLLETIRAYAGEKLERAGEVAELRTAHARFYLSLAEQAEPELTGPCQERWLEQLEAERSNLRAAFEWSLSRGQTDLALRLAGALVLFWRVRCHFSEGRDLLEAVLSGGEAGPPALTAKVLWGAGFLTFMAGDAIGAIPTLEQSLASFRALGDRQGQARALLILANARQIDDDPSVLEMLEQSAELAREEGDSWCLAHALGVAGFEYARNDEPHHARRVLEECLAVARESGDKQSLRIGLLGLGEVAVGQGAYREAQSLLEEAVAVTGELGEDFGQATALRYLGALALARGDYGRALDLVDQSLDCLPELALAHHRLEALLLLARVAHAQGDRRQARRLLEEASAQATGPSLLRALGELAVDEGDSGEGRRLLEQARTLAEAGGTKRELAKVLHSLGQLSRDEGDPEGAAGLHDEALELHHQLGTLSAIAESLEAAGGLAAAAGQHRHAARLFGAASALRQRGGYARAPWASARYDADRALCRSLPAAELRSAFAHGEALTVEQAVAEATKGLRRVRGTRGWASLTGRELQVAELVGDGLANLEIAERLVIAPETVKTHMSNVFSKLGMTGRSELAREVRSRNGGPR